MGSILAAYVVSVACNRIMNWMDWWAHNRKSGAFTYYRLYGPMLIGTAIIHVPLFALWYEGILLPAVNMGLGAVTAAISVTGAEISLPQLSEVTTLSTLAAGWIMDSFGSRIAKWFRARFSGKKEEA